MKWEVINADCKDALRDIPDGSIHAVITDPPYGIDYQSARRIDNRARLPKIANDKKPFTVWLPEAFRVTRNGGALLCFCRWDVQEAFRVAIIEAGFDVKSQVIWDREAHGMGDLEGAFAPQHDIIWFAVKGAFKFPSARPKSILRYLRLSGDALLHPNEKPVDLMRHLVKAVTYNGDTVLDCFTGSGSTGEACVIEGRSFIGIEIDPHYTEVARARISRASGIACDIPKLIRTDKHLPLFAE